MNRLADEPSPYLQQHAHNPVHWYPWGTDALEHARSEQMPIFLSVGYSACHWCHVMERESFESEVIASFLNEHFVCIKVDREERPDVDNIYMEAVQVMTGQGGWPMSVFLTPQLEPFFAGTYFPPEDRWGRTGFLSLLRQLKDVWEEDQDKVTRVCAQVTARLRAMAETTPGAKLDLEPLDRAFEYYVGVFDPKYAGFGEAPKFPPSMALRCLLHLAADEKRPTAQRTVALDMVERTLVQMASGGMFDQIGGGFHRYSTDAEWLVPHFEKMLYDNALLLQVYTEAYQATGRGFYERIVRETVDYVLREMVSPRGAFYSAQDADSEGVEGKYFVWNPEQIEAVLGADDATLAKDYWGVEGAGNFEGDSIPSRLDAISSDWTEALADLPEAMVGLRTRLLEARVERVAPETDRKVLAAWNGLMITALARAGAVFGEAGWIDAASDAARFVLSEMGAEAGGIYRTFKDGARVRGYLDDHVNLAAGLFDLFEATSELRWLEEAEALVDFFVDEFWDPDGGAFYFAAEHHTDLLVRQKEGYDGATPASNSIAVMTLLRVSAATGRPELRDIADTCLRSYYPQMLRAPHSLAEMIQALDFHLTGAEEVVCVTPQGATSLAAEAWREYRRNGIIFDVHGDNYAARVPVAQGRGPLNHAPTLYVCHEGTCELPRNES